MPENRKYYLPVDGQLVEVTREVYTTYYKALRKELYQDEQQQRNGVVSYDALDNGDLIGESMFSDSHVLTTEESYLAKEEYKRLISCIQSLDIEDQKLIHAIYYENKSQREYAQAEGISKSGMAYRHGQVLMKLRKKMNTL